MSIVTPVTSQVQKLRGGNAQPGLYDHLLISRTPSSPFLESFRLLAANVETALESSASKAVVIASAHHGDGRTVVAANLAIALAERQRVLLVEEHRRALSDMLLSDLDVKRNGIPAHLRASVVETSEANVYIMASTEQPMQQSGRLAETIDMANDAGMVAVIDSPPAEYSSDAFLLAKYAGNVLYVVRTGDIDLEEQARIKNQFERLGARFVGIVLNEF